MPKPRRPFLKRRAALALGLAACVFACKAERAQEQDAAARPVSAPARGEAASGHLTLAGDYCVDRDSLTTCALFPDRSFQVAFSTPQAPYVFLYVKRFSGAGIYDAEARVRANYSGETMRVSSAATRTEIRVAPGPGHRDLISGSFAGQYAGEGGKGTVAGRFANCLYRHLPQAR